MCVDVDVALTQKYNPLLMPHNKVVVQRINKQISLLAFVCHRSRYESIYLQSCRLSRFCTNSKIRLTFN